MAYLGIGITNAAAISLILQTIAYIILLAGFIFAKKKDFKIHKKTMIIATLLNFASLFIVMLPSLYAIISGISFATFRIIFAFVVTIPEGMVNGPEISFPRKEYFAVMGSAF